jgi:hypothetical protein
VRRAAFVFACLMMLPGVWSPGRALAHPTALSQFDIYTGERDVSLGFAFDATSFVELLGRLEPQRAQPEKSEVSVHLESFLPYFDQRFAIGNAGVGCARQKPTRFALAAERDRVLFDVRFQCAAPLSFLTLSSRLFDDEAQPHPLVGTLRHRGALEHYYLSPGGTASVRLDTLKPVHGVSLANGGTFRTSTPPSGHYARGKNTSERGFAFFVRQGLSHIFAGIDHLLFVFTLLVAARGLRELAFIITSFTFAHSITLGLGALGLVNVSPRWVEPAIALSIAYVAAENVLRREPRHRALLTFAFGLVHGLGFGGALRELGVQGAEWISALAGFNVGVELGQLAVVLAVFPLVLWARSRKHIYTWVRASAGATVVLMSLVWFAQRVAASFALNPPQ